MDGVLVAYTLVAMMYIYVLLYSPSVSYYRRGRKIARLAPRRSRRQAAVAAAPAAVAVAAPAAAVAAAPEPEDAPVEEYSYEYPSLY